MNRRNVVTVSAGALLTILAVFAAVIGVLNSNRAASLEGQNQNLNGQVAAQSREISSQSAEISHLNTVAGARESANQSSLGVCFSTNTYTDMTTNLTFITGVTVSTPNLTGSAVSCANGSFIPVVPTGNGG